MGEPAPAWQGRGTRPEPREMPITILRTRVSPLWHLALPQKGPVPRVRVSCCPTGLVAALWHQGRTRGARGAGWSPEGCRELCWPCPACPRRRGGWSCWEMGGGTGQPCQQQPWHWGFSWAGSQPPSPALPFRPGRKIQVRRSGFISCHQLGLGLGRAQHNTRSVPGAAQSLSQHLGATSQARGCQGSVVQVLGSLLLPLALGGLGCTGGLAAEPQSLSVPSQCPQSSWHCRWVTPLTHLGSAAPRAAVPSWGAPRPHSRAQRGFCAWLDKPCSSCAAQLQPQPSLLVQEGPSSHGAGTRSGRRHGAEQLWGVEQRRGVPRARNAPCARDGTRARDIPCARQAPGVGADPWLRAVSSDTSPILGRGECSLGSHP
ncbi:uncharacterized protein LOC117006948 [Catharus ustulatus]|uniref:uncharacterized protein LOC117006948 n=1 Tax=Catharus ustulatus TaxID=91951 RepID=UPI00140ACCD2|nr:uncharacterized protein LOC117006948 [Catharus ustulatus]